MLVICWTVGIIVWALTLYTALKGKWNVTGTKRYYQEVDIRAVFKHYVKGFKMPGDAAVVHWDANYDAHTGKVWFRIDAEDPAPVEDHKLVVPDKTIVPMTHG